MFSFKNKKVLIFGLGILGGGVGAVKFLVKQGAEVRVTDLKKAEKLTESLNKLKNFPIKYTLGHHLKEDFLWADLVIRNPDVPLKSFFLQFCFQNKIKVEMEASLFAKLCPAKIIGVTGTRGKSTTTVLIAQILKQAGLTVFTGGNLPQSNTLGLLEKINKNSVVILELSSWQLEGFGWEKISPQISVITNIYPDHLNRYDSMSDYIADKSNIFLFQKKNDWLILNQDNKITLELAKQAKGKTLLFSSKNLPSAIRNSLLLTGEHNLENLAASYSVAKLFKVDDQLIKKAVSHFQGLPFRQEIIRTVKGITYVNDSTSTTPIAGLKAIEAFSHKSIILICGGNSKNLPTEEFIKTIINKVRKVVLLEGTMTDEIESGIMNHESGRNKKRVYGRFDNLQQAVTMAQKEAKSGEIVLFSPAATSFNMFENEFDRGEKFNQIIKQLK